MVWAERIREKSRLSWFPLGSYRLQEPWALNGFQLPLHPFSSLPRYVQSHPRAFAPAFPCAWMIFQHFFAWLLPSPFMSQLWCHSLNTLPQAWLAPSLLLGVLTTRPLPNVMPFSSHASQHWWQSVILWISSLPYCLSPSGSDTSSMRKIMSYGHQLDPKT